MVCLNKYDLFLPSFLLGKCGGSTFIYKSKIFLLIYLMPYLNLLLTW